MTDAPGGGQVRRRLLVMRWIALLDLILLIALVASSLSGQREFVRVLGPLHGINFLLLVVVAAKAAIDGLWGWWFPAAILLTAEPPGALIGEWVIARRGAAQSPEGESRTTQGERQGS
jgi:hypothetical protein